MEENTVETEAATPVEEKSETVETSEPVAQHSEPVEPEGAAAEPDSEPEVESVEVPVAVVESAPDIPFVSTGTSGTGTATRPGTDDVREDDRRGGTI